MNNNNNNNIHNSKHNTNSTTSAKNENSTLNNKANNKDMNSIQVYKNDNTIKQSSPITHPLDDSVQIKNNNNQRDISINIETQKFPYSIVWTKLPCLSVILPFIGHTGIGTSKGIIHDFSGNYFISIDRLAFGAPLKYIQLLDLTPEQKLQWDTAIEESDNKFLTTKHQLFSNNCHHHCAYVLNKIKYKGKSTYGTCGIINLLCCYSKFISCKGWCITYWCTLITCIVIIITIIIILCIYV